MPISLAARRPGAAMRWTMLAVVASLIFMAPVPAKATTVQCGDVLTVDTTLDSDLFCSESALIVGADGITIDLNGHSIVWVGAPGFANGIHNQGFDDVAILNGEITGFLNGVSIFGVQGNLITHLRLSNNTFSGVNVLRGGDLAPSSFNEISHIGIDSSPRGIVLQQGAHDNAVAHNSIDNAIFYGIGLFSGAGTNDLNHNSISSGPGQGILLDTADYNNVIGNTVIGATGNGILLQNGATWNVVAQNELMENGFSGINLLGNSDHNEISRNTVTEHGGGILVQQGSDYTSLDRNTIVGGILSVQFSHFSEITRNTIADGPSLGISIFNSNWTEVSQNRSTGNGFDGIRISAGSFGSVLTQNTSSYNGSHGINVANSATSLTKNQADFNGQLGINAVPGVTDGGGNQAENNGNPLECINVTC